MEPLSVDPTDAEICENGSTCGAGTDLATFIISGGSGSYSVTSSDHDIIPDPGSLSGNTFTVNAIDDRKDNEGDTTDVILTVSDDVTAETVIVTVTVTHQISAFIRAGKNPPFFCYTKNLS